ncbi:VENN motif pre-toxin domain-containing protein, partial [Pasteurellaceae bacterium LIM206]|nr:VENN motif pre-toxin domain-containing protein [Pasteurellaceae bacterium LIM206]
AQKNTITVLSQLAGGLAGGLLGDSTQSAVLSSEVSKRAVENNYLKENEALAFERELKTCKEKGEDCSPIYKKYIEISNENFKATRERCVTGGVYCANMEEVISAANNIALVKYDTSGKIYWGDYLTDDDAINFVNYANGSDLTYLNNRISTSDRVLAQVTDITNWPFLFWGAKNLITNTGKETVMAAGISSVVNTGFQYTFNDGPINWSDVVSAGLVGKMTAGRSYGTVISGNTLGGYYSSKITGLNDNEAAMSALVSKAGSMVGYSLGEVTNKILTPMFNPTYKQYEWSSIGLGISHQKNPSIVPSTSANVADSISSETLQKTIKE